MFKPRLNPVDGARWRGVAGQHSVYADTPDAALAELRNLAGKNQDADDDFWILEELCFDRPYGLDTPEDRALMEALFRTLRKSQSTERSGEGILQKLRGILAGAWFRERRE